MKRTPIQRAAIVDPYSSGAMLAPELANHGCECVAVLGTSEVPSIFRSSYQPGDFMEVIHHDGNIESTVASLRTQDIRLVLAGSEPGVELADELSERLGLPSNGTALSHARRNKFHMIETAKQHGLRTPAQCRAEQLPELLAWVRSHSRWPVIVKPLAGCASDGVHCCQSESEVTHAFDGIIGKPNILGLTNHAVLAQEFLHGTEYIVDTVSCAGRHRRAAFWKYQKPTAGPFVCYDAMELLSFHGPIQDKLFSYACDVLDALQIKVGPAHCELMWIDDQPVLIEIGARLSAGINAILPRLCGAKTCALDLDIDAYFHPEKFIEEADRLLDLPRAGANALLMPSSTGRLKALPKVSNIESLRSFHRMSIGAKIGQMLPRVAGIVTLIHSDRQVVAEDLKTIREIQGDGFYEIDAH